MRILRTCVMVGIFAVAAGCDTSSAPVPVTPLDSGKAGGDAAAVDSGGGGGDAAAVDSGGGGDVSAEDSSNGGNDSTVADSGNEAAVADGGDGGTDATVADGGDGGASEAAVADGGGDAKVADGGDGGSEAAVADSGGDAKVADGGDGGGEAAVADGGGDAGACVLPSCLTSLETNCAPSGTCSQVNDMASGNTYVCFANGITLGNFLDLNGDNTIMVKGDASTCYSLEYTGNDIGNSTTDVPVWNGSDAGVATLHQDIVNGSTQVWSVTCGSGQPVTLDPSCQSVWPLAWIEWNNSFNCTGTASCTW